MKVILAILGFGIFSPVLYAVEKDVWYNAKGKVVRVTPAEKERERFVPQWEKREKAMAVQRAARRDGRIRREGIQRYYEYRYPVNYGWYGGCGGRYHSGYYGSRWRFSGVYRGNGWSVRLNY